jgi:O-antigen ligase
MALAQSRGAALALALAVTLLVFPRIGWRRSIATLAVAGALGTATVVINGLMNEPVYVEDASQPGGSSGGHSFDPITRDRSTDVTSGRVEIYRELVISTREHPLGGTGYRTTELNPDLDGTAGHNIYLSTFAEVGLIGGVAFLVLLAIPLLRSLRRYRPSLGAAWATGTALVVGSEVFESSILGWGSPTTLTAWLLLLSGACAIDVRSRTQSPTRMS